MTAAPALGVAPMEFIGAFESTYQPAHDVDGTETTRHNELWREDLALLSSCGLRRLRYPVRWHRVERRPGEFDWRSTDQVLGHLRDHGFRPIVDLCHHTSYPRWISDFSDARFGPAFLRFVGAFARRYPWVEEYTLFNEPFTTFLLCGHEGVWPPYLRGLEGMVRVAGNVFPAIAQASRMLLELLPAARHVYVEACEGHTFEAEGAAMAALANDRRFLFTDLFLGRPLDPARPFVAEVLAAGGESLLAMAPGHVDVLGLDYYAHNQWHWTGRDQGVCPSPVPVSLAELIVEYWERFGIPCMLGETNIRGLASDRASWLKHTLEQCELVRDAGVPMGGYCWFPFIDSCDWNTLLARCDASVDPVGVFWLDEHMARRTSPMATSYALAAGGKPSTALPAYRFQPPVSEWLQGFLPYMAHWEWQAALPSETAPSERRALPNEPVELRLT